MMCQGGGQEPSYAPLYVHGFKLIAPHRLVDAQVLQQKYHSYEDIGTVPDRLRWCRHHRGLMQREVADQVGVCRNTYWAFEAGECEQIPYDVAKKLSQIYEVPVADLLPAAKR